MEKWVDHIGETVKARFSVEHNVDGADVPLLYEDTVTICQDEHGSIFLDSEDWDILYPFDEHFNIIK
jgi:hypothetical protein